MLGFALSKLGLLADAEADYANAIDLHVEARGVFARAGDQGGAGYTLSRASMSAYCLGDYAQAMQHALAAPSARPGHEAARCGRARIRLLPSALPAPAGRAWPSSSRGGSAPPPTSSRARRCRSGG
jgi:hypothetical protein